MMLPTAVLPAATPDYLELRIPLGIIMGVLAVILWWDIRARPTHHDDHEEP